MGRTQERLRVLAAQLDTQADVPEGKGPAEVQRCATSSSAFDDCFPQAQTMRSFPPAVHDLLQLEALLTPADNELRSKVRAFMEAEVAPVIVEYWEKAQFPFELVPKLAKLGLGGGTIQGYGCPGLSVTAMAMGVVEIARVDASMSTFLLVHNCLAALTVGLLGSEAQKQEWLPGMANLTKVGCWALTEPSNGSDASALTATATRVPGGWRLNGQKRWIGNGTWADISVIWARNMETQQVNAFIVRKGAPGFTAKKIENKIALRCVQNADMVFKDVFVPDSDRLEGVNSFQDTNKVLAISRIMVAWQPVGICMGVYDMCVRYTKQREQFGRPIAAFQLSQERLARMAGTIQAMFLMALRLSQLSEGGTMSHSQASLVKAWITSQARQVCAQGRELLGGNGVVSDFLVAKAFCDLEAIYTYEGTYDINSLVAGRDITGIAAFKAR